jgi:hypothetical protein
MSRNRRNVEWIRVSLIAVIALGLLTFGNCRSAQDRTIASENSDQPHTPGQIAAVQGTIEHNVRVHPAVVGTSQTETAIAVSPNTFDYDEVKDVLWSAQDEMLFETQDTRFNEDLDYDIASGFLSELRVDGHLPPSGDGHYFLVRAHGAAGVGTYGDGEPAARINVRGPLDETLAICP